MKRIVIAILLLAGINGAAYAQDQEQAAAPQMGMRQMKSPEQRAQMLTDRLDKKLNLSDDQKKSVYDINLNTAQKMNDAMQNHDRGAMRSIKQERDDAMQKVLTADQYKQYQEMETAMMQKRMQSRQSRMNSDNSNN
ncbi:MAG: DUF4890 domain-containing protein [Flavipsychrobacter sp.]